MLKTSVPAYFKKRRDALMAANPGAAFLLPGTEEVYRNANVEYPYRQESSFYYLTGWDEPGAFLALVPQASGPGAYRTILFVRKRDPEREMWDGARYGTEGAHKIFGADEAYLITELDSKLPEILKGSERVFYRTGKSDAWDRRVLAGLEAYRLNAGRSGKALAPLHDPQEVIGEMRLFKSAEEIEIHRKACSISARVHKQVMETVKPGMFEYEVEALVDSGFRRAGCGRVGYGSIIAGGNNAACLHYRSNNEELRDGQLLLIDAGGEYDYYTADITRTFPIGRTFSKIQAQVYDLVLEAQKSTVAMAKPGARLTELHRHSCEVLTEGMIRFGLLKGTVSELIESGKFRQYYPHGTGHYLGMDVHDVGLYNKNGQPRLLEPGMVFTVEPGFYVQPDDRDAPEEWRGIGIRIEDDILITTSGHENMTREAPKERAEVEALRARAF